MNTRRLGPILVTLAAGSAPGVAAQAVYRVGPPPAWAAPVALTIPPPSGRAGESFEMLLVDRQEVVRVSGRGSEQFFHLAYRVLDEGAVRENSQLEIVFDSSYQELILHSAVVKRNGRTINQLTAGRIRVAQREQQLEYQIYDGSLSVVLLLEDVRRGDVIEYSYTRRGANPVFSGHYMASFLVQQTWPLHRVRFRLLLPRDRRLYVRRHETGLEPVVREAGESREYVWDARGMPAKVLEGDLPDWYDALPYIQLSDFASWAEVAAWGDSLFRFRGPLPRELAAPVARIRAASTSPVQRVLDALRFVQDEVRYLGVEIGVNSHLPYPPATVIRRRYGDCKDKTLLLVTMLRELGVTARPALVSTSYRGRIGDLHPTAYYFDHAIAQVEIDGRAHWVDPSALYERGDLRDVGANYGRALVLGAPGDPLVDIADARTPGPLTEVAVSFELGGIDSPAAMRVHTQYRGSAAISTRSTISGTSLEELQRRYVEFYAELYPSIHPEAPLEVHDDEQANVIRTVERYAVPDFWRRPADADGEGEDTGRVGTFEPLELSSAVPAARSARRTMPLAVNHRTHIRYTITARMKEGWSIRPEETRIATPGARVHYRARAQGEVLTLEYEYETLADHVAAGPAAAEHIEGMARARRVLAYSITPPGGPAAAGAGGLSPGEMNWLVLFAGLTVALGAAWAASRVHRLQAVGWPRGPVVSPSSPRGLGGWLILVGIGVCVTPIRILVELGGTLPSYGASTWAALTTPGAGQYHALWAPLLLFELAANVALLVFAGLQVALFFGRRRVFPAFFVVFLGAQALLAVLDATFATAIPAVVEQGTPFDDVPRTVLIAALWIAYMFRSERVQATFVN